MMDIRPSLVWSFHDFNNQIRQMFEVQLVAFTLESPVNIHCSEQIKGPDNVLNISSVSAILQATSK